MNMKLSIVVPIFNVEPFLEKCLNSLYFQNINEENYEVLLINDGSLDKSGMIAKQYCKEHPTILIILNIRIKDSLELEIVVFVRQRVIIYGLLILMTG